MRKAIVIAALAATVCLLSGCDFFRVLAGRPTSRQIAEKRVLIEQELAAAGRRRDSLDQARLQHEADSLAADSLAADSLRCAGQAPEQQAGQAGQTAPAGQTGQTVPAKQQQLQQQTGRTISTRNLSAVEGNVLTHHYYLMIGAFGNRDNAERQAARAEKAGYPATLISFKSGMTAVGVSPTDDLNEAWATLNRLRNESFCPKDAWILNNE